MKKRIILLTVLILFAVATIVSAFSLTSTGEITASGAYVPQKCLLGGVLIITNGTNDATIIVYDNASSAAGDKLWESVVTGACNIGGGLFPHAIRANNGLYVSVSGTGASCIVYYALR